MQQLLGRPPSGAFRVVVRRRDGTPAVIENEPWLADGTPMPTRYWLVDRHLRSAVSRLESEGGVRRAEQVVGPAALAEAHARYAATRDAAVGRAAAGGEPDGAPRGAVAGRRPPSGGVGGTRQGVKCLHAHVAWTLVGGGDPVGAWALDLLGVGSGDFVWSETPADSPVGAPAPSGRDAVGNAVGISGRDAAGGALQS